MKNDDVCKQYEDIILRLVPENIKITYLTKPKKLEKEAKIYKHLVNKNYSALFMLNGLDDLESNCYQSEEFIHSIIQYSYRFMPQHMRFKKRKCYVNGINFTFQNYSPNQDETISEAIERLEQEYLHSKKLMGLQKRKYGMMAIRDTLIALEERKNDLYSEYSQTKRYQK